MNISWKIAAALLATTLFSHPAASQASPILSGCSPTPATDIPTDLWEDDTADGQPGCRSCVSSIVVKDDEEAAVLELYFVPDDAEDVDADIEVRLFLEDEDVSVIVIMDVTLLDQELHTFPLEIEDGVQWSQVKRAEVEIIPLATQ